MPRGRKVVCSVWKRELEPDGITWKEEARLVENGLMFESISDAYFYWYGRVITPHKRDAMRQRLNKHGKCYFAKDYESYMEVRDKT